jgi:Gluconate 2-dehydrogenase subunit 3
MIRPMEIRDREVSSLPIEARSPTLFSRRELIRAALFASAASVLGPSFSLSQAINSGLTAAARGEDGSKVLSDPNWKPVFFNEHQNETVIALGEVIIPATDTPGAKDALVNRFIDLLLSAQPAEFKKQFTDALTFMDAESQKQFENDFCKLSADDQISLLMPWAFARAPSHWTARNRAGELAPDQGQQSFELLKTLIVSAYYNSEVGQKELGWDGEITHGPYQGCQHAAGTHT